MNACSWLFLLCYQYEALAWLCGGLSFFASLGLLAVWNDKASKYPFVSLLFQLAYSTLLEFGFILQWMLAEFNSIIIVVHEMLYIRLIMKDWWMLELGCVLSLIGFHIVLISCLWDVFGVMYFHILFRSFGCMYCLWLSLSSDNDSNLKIILN